MQRGTRVLSWACRVGTEGPDGLFTCRKTIASLKGCCAGSNLRTETGNTGWTYQQRDLDSWVQKSLAIVCAAQAGSRTSGFMVALLGGRCAEGIQDVQEHLPQLLQMVLHNGSHDFPLQSLVWIPACTPTAISDGSMLYRLEVHDRIPLIVQIPCDWAKV